MEKLLLLLAAVPFGVGFLVSTEAAEPEHGIPVLTFADDRIVESSGLVVRDGLVVTVNDSGDGNRIFTVDLRTGETVGVTEWQGEADDIEALAPAGDGEVYVGDIGDNDGRRDTIQVARVPFGDGDREVDALTYELAYPDGPHDAETLLVHPGTGQLFVVAKEFIGRLYAVPEEPTATGRNRLELVDEVLGIATDGAFFPDGRHLVLRNYAQAAIYTWPDLERVALFDLPRQPQGEGIAVSERGDLFVSTEGVGTEVLRVPLSAGLRAQLADSEPAPGTGDDRADDDVPGQDEPGQDEPDEVAAERSVWPWAIGAVAGVVIIVVLLRSLRPR